MRAPVFRLSHTSSGVYADKLKSPYQSDKKVFESTKVDFYSNLRSMSGKRRYLNRLNLVCIQFEEYDDEDNTKEGSEEEEYSEADEVQYYEDTTPLPPLHVIDAEL